MFAPARSHVEPLPVWRKKPGLTSPIVHSGPGIPPRHRQDIDPQRLGWPDRNSAHQRFAPARVTATNRQCLGKRRIPTLAVLQRETAAWNAKANHDHVKINWQFTRRKARQKFSYRRSKRNQFTRSKTWSLACLVWFHCHIRASPDYRAVVEPQSQIPKIISSPNIPDHLPTFHLPRQTPILHGFKFQTMKDSRTRNRAPILVVVSRNSLQFQI